MVWVPKLRGKGEDFLDISNVFFEECTIGGGARSGSDMVEHCMNEGLDEGESQLEGVT